MGPRTGAGMQKRREEAIRLKGSYLLRWTDFSEIGVDGYGKFRYLAVTVLRSNTG